MTVTDQLLKNNENYIGSIAKGELPSHRPSIWPSWPAWTHASCTRSSVSSGQAFSRQPGCSRSIVGPSLRRCDGNHGTGF